MADSILLPPEDDTYSERVTMEAFDRMREKLKNTPDPILSEYYIQFNVWLATGFYYNEDGQIIGWHDPSPRCGDANQTP